ncbi:CHAT domain-containing protein [Saccharicrinis sp. FJH2]|uniref:CHAT domain-containing protein n=1 Tax=Saccharicrinis sp. FJH65 TaxID=3344659 RepID=UPI0035F3447B
MKYLAVISFLLISTAVFCNVDGQLSGLQKAVSDKDYHTARQLFQEDTSALIAEQNFLDLSYFISYAGYIADYFKEDGRKTVENMRDFILDHSENQRDKRQAWLEIHTYYRNKGKLQEAYDANAKALEISRRIEDIEPRELAMIEQNLGVIASEMNQLSLAKSHILKAANDFEKDPKTDESDQLNILNSLGATYWYEAQYDSVAYYWLRALAFIDSMSPSLTNQYYYKSMLEGNLSALYDVMGKTQESINIAKRSIDDIQYFTVHAKDDPRWNRALLSLLYSANNLATVYYGVGNYAGSLKLHEFIYNEKIGYYPPDHPEIFFTAIQIGISYYALHRFSEAGTWLMNGINGYKKYGDTYHKNLADAYSTLALIHEAEKNFPDAKKYYRLAEGYYNETYGEKFDFVYLNFLKNATEFYALHDDQELAVELSQKGLNYVSKAYGKTSLIGFRQMLNLGTVYFNINEYSKAKETAEQSLAILDKLRVNAESGLDSVKIDLDKPGAIVLKEKSVYQLAQNRTVAFLDSMLQELNRALLILEKRKTVYSDPDNVQVMLSQNEETIEFIKKILLELYEKTGDENYINQLLKLQEETVYTKIRAHLNQLAGIAFYGVPDSVLEQERKLKTAINDLVNNDGNLTEYLTAMDKWDAFRNMLKKRYPEYYRLRYAGITEDELQPAVSGQVVRYMFVDSTLLAIVFHDGEKSVFELNFEPGLVTELAQVWNDRFESGRISYTLYQQLWQPFDSLLNHGSVIIIPDGILYNLSFDLLTRQPITDFTQYRTMSLLSNYYLSYHYSLWFSNYHGSKKFKSSYAGFVPGFSDQMKEDYMTSVTDSTKIDRAYLHLLPQPFTVALSGKISKLFDGNSFPYEQSTVREFREKASGNKIIHIGTHAESNNVSPVYSRLIFAKDKDPGLQENSLFAYEIYGTDMNSNLTLLTACETGKPQYKPGEGMVSLAHAFLYAGSESLLISLWNQDEKTGMDITDYFVKSLAKGLPKDRALREAKLKYLEKTNNRTLSPQYWAGMVIIGNSEPVAGLKSYHQLLWGVFGSAFAILLILLIWYRHK